MKKSQVLLYIGYLLNKKGEFSKNEVISETGISDSAFYKDIQEIKAFYCNFNMDMTIVYVRSKDKYVLVKDVL